MYEIFVILKEDISFKIKMYVKPANNLFVWIYVINLFL